MDNVVMEILLIKQKTKNGLQGGFDSGAVATANILESSTPQIGGKHQLITATVKDGKLYICKAQAGDKRWFKGARKFVESAASSFSVA